MVYLGALRMADGKNAKTDRAADRRNGSGSVKKQTSVVASPLGVWFMTE